MPIFDQKCISCHGEEKQKGKLRMDTYEALIAGGKEGEGMVPGDATTATSSSGSNFRSTMTSTCRRRARSRSKTTSWSS